MNGEISWGNIKICCSDACVDHVMSQDGGSTKSFFFFYDVRAISNEMLGMRVRNFGRTTEHRHAYVMHGNYSLYEGSHKYGDKGRESVLNTLQRTGGVI